ncbi:MAG: GNAT family N-acetyltransferase [Oscillospiraceae bacterium]|nr:GNAT family N-acetyltransferase [Oscillospiraceae bacterium]
MDIGTTIKKMRIHHRITQQQLADRLNVSVQTVSRWETSANYPDIVMLPIIARFFRVSVDYLLYGGNKMNTISSERLMIRSWEEGDAADLLDAKQNSSNFLEYLTIDTPKESAECIKLWQDFGEMFPIVLKQTGKLVGVAGLVDVGRYKGYRELELHLCDEYNNSDFCTEALSLILEYGFCSTDLSVAFCLCKSDEMALQQALEKAGFVYEGTLRKFGRDKCDRLRYSIIRKGQ